MIAPNVLASILSSTPSSPSSRVLDLRRSLSTSEAGIHVRDDPTKLPVVDPDLDSLSLKLGPDRAATLAISSQPLHQERLRHEHAAFALGLVLDLGAVLVDNCDLLQPSCEAAGVKQRLDALLSHLRPGRLDHPRFDAGCPRQRHSKRALEVLRGTVVADAGIERELVMEVVVIAVQFRPDHFMHIMIE